jgi:hypothetical protein
VVELKRLSRNRRLVAVGCGEGVDFELVAVPDEDAAPLEASGRGCQAGGQPFDALRATSAALMPSNARPRVTPASMMWRSLWVSAIRV